MFLPWAVGEMERLEEMGEWDQQWGKGGRESERKRRRDEWEEEGWGVWEMEEGDGTLHCGNYTKCDPIPILNSESRAATSVGERDERENGNVEMEGNDDVGAMEGHGESNGSIEDVRGGTPGEAPRGESTPMDGGGGGGKIQMGSLISGCPPPGRRPLKGKRRGGRGVKAKEDGVLALYMSRWLATKHRDQGLQLEDSSGTTDTGS